MIISIASGKGGTGKTTVSTNLAAIAEQQITFMDCDVEEPNAHLFLKPAIDQSEKIYSMVPMAHDGQCDGCKKCIDICRFNAITVVANSVLIFPELCHGCGGCMLVCPHGVLSESNKELGIIESGTRGNVRFLHGKLRIGEPMAPPLIKRLRREEIHTEDTIIDAPPGTSCPVIESVKNVDFVVLVTEPTPFGLHDLTLAHETVKQLQVPCGVVINKANLGDDGVEEYAKKNSLPVLLRIPFSREIAEKYSKGLLIAEDQIEWREIFKTLYQTIAKRIQYQGR